jgi:hypothetical protein
MAAEGGTRGSRPADAQLQAFLAEADLAALQQPLWDESLHECLRVLEAEKRVGLISWLRARGVGPQPVRQRLATALAKAHRAGDLGHVTPPAWQYVPPLPAEARPTRGRTAPRTAAVAAPTHACETAKASPRRCCSGSSATEGPPSTPRTPHRNATPTAVAVGARPATESPPSPRRPGATMAMAEPSERSAEWHDRRAACSPARAPERTSVSDPSGGLLGGVSSLWRRLTRREAWASGMDGQAQGQTSQQVALGLL